MLMLVQQTRHTLYIIFHGNGPLPFLDAVLTSNMTNIVSISQKQTSLLSIFGRSHEDASL